MKEINKILDDNEQTLWEGRPEFLPYFVSILPLALFGLPFLLVPLFFGPVFFIIPHFWVGLAFVIGLPLYQYYVYRHIYYAVTNKRVILQTGLIGRDFQIIDFDQITNAEVNVGIFDQLFTQGKTGSILVSSAGTFVHTKHGPAARPYSLRNIRDPYTVFKFIKKVSHDVKTDIEYPNKLRPEENPGYSTSYTPK